MPIASAISPEAVRLLEVAAELGPTITSLRDEIERERRLPAELVETLRELGFFSLWLAKDFGGLELSLTDYVRVTEALSRYDGSVGWCAGIAASYCFFSGFLPEPVARRIFVDDRALVAGQLTPQGKAEVVDGGYRVTGRWAYGSGINHSEWILGGCVVHDGEGPRNAVGIGPIVGHGDLDDDAIASRRDVGIPHAAPRALRLSGAWKPYSLLRSLQSAKVGRPAGRR
jgi:hypothetical protein